MSLIGAKPLNLLVQINFWHFKLAQTIVFAYANEPGGSETISFACANGFDRWPTRTPWLDWVATDVRRPLWESLSTRIWAEPFFSCWRLAGLACSWKRARWVPNHWFCLCKWTFVASNCSKPLYLLAQMGLVVSKPLYLLVQMFTVFLNLIKTSLKVSILVHQVQKSWYFECGKHMRLSNHCFCLSKSRFEASVVFFSFPN